MIYRSCRQGGVRYFRTVSPLGKPFEWNFQDGFYIPAASVWNQLTSEAEFAVVDTSDFFDGEVGPLYVEIGIGNGEFAVHRAAMTPKSLWFGFEVYHKAFYKAASRIKRAGLQNVRIVQFDAELFVRMFPEDSISEFFVNFPDPWPKTKHKKRRLLKTWFIELMRDRLVPGGLITVVTDHEDYAEEIIVNFAQTNGLKSTLGAPCATDIGDYYKTKYYRKFAANSRIFFFNMQKV